MQEDVVYATELDCVTVKYRCRNCSEVHYLTAMSCHSNIKNVTEHSCSGGVTGVSEPIGYKYFPRHSEEPTF